MAHYLTQTTINYAFLLAQVTCNSLLKFSKISHSLCPSPLCFTFVAREQNILTNMKQFYIIFKQVHMIPQNQGLKLIYIWVVGYLTLKPLHVGLMPLRTKLLAHQNLIQSHLIVIGFERNMVSCRFIVCLYVGTLGMAKQATVLAPTFMNILWFLTSLSDVFILDCLLFVNICFI